MKTVKLILAGMLMALACAAQNQPVTITGTPQPAVITTVTNSGTTGSTTYCYWVVANYTGGNAAPAGPSCTSTSNATLSATNFNTVNWLAPTSPLSSVTQYDVLRTTSQTPPTGACACAVATAVSSSAVTQTDTSNTLSAYTVSTASNSFQMYVDNSTSTTPTLTVKSGTLTQGLVDSTGAANTNVSGVSPVYAAYGSATTAQINAGLTIVPAVAGRTYKILGALVQAIGGAAAGCTAIQFADTAGTPIVGLSWTVAALTQNTFVTSDTAPAVGALTATTFLTGLTAGKGIQILKTGSACTTLTSLNYRIFYTVQ